LVKLRRSRGVHPTLEILKEISGGIRQLGNKLDRLIELQQGRSLKQSEIPLDVDSILSLPDHLTKTAMVIAKIKEGTALDVAKETGRARAAESDYLNQLVSMGYIKKRRVMRRVVFSVES
jgi:predicted transcriptional regulator